MDTDEFIRWLRDTWNECGTASKQRIIRFQKPNDYRRFVREWTKVSAAKRPEVSLKGIGLIHAVACPLETAVPARFGSRLWIEEDPRVTVNGADKRSAAPEHGIAWGVRQIKAPAAWATTTGYRVKVGVIDTGADYSHPDLRNSLAGGINLMNRSMLPHDDNGHGTHIAATIAASGGMHGMLGVAPRASVHPVKAFDHNGSAYVSDIILGIEWCIRNRVRIINMSFGMQTRSKALLGAINSAAHSGIIVIASSGNDGKTKTVDYPARFPQTVSVGATTRMRRIAPFSNRGLYIDIYAPGDRVVSAWLRGGHRMMSGTSMATSHVSGAVALLLAKRPELTPAELKAILKRSSQPVRGIKSSRGAGEIDVMRMLQALD